MNEHKKPVLLIVDDDEDIRTQLKWALCDSHEVVLAEDRPSATQAFRQHQPEVTLLDLGMPPMPAGPEEGMAALSEMLAVRNRAKIIVLSGQSDRSNALRAVNEGAYDFLVKPPEIDELKVVVKRASEMARMEREIAEMRHQLEGESFEGMLGGSPQMQVVFDAIRKVASSHAPVLLLGASGTGKEMAARAIHRKSSRPEGPFVAINCGAIPEALLESELFGHEKGSFTGAHMQRIGRIETASGGTLFLDEIGDLPLPLQVKLLRFLQEQKIERVGGRKEIEVDTRIVAATNADLKRALQEGKFREDLYYRIAVVSIRIPPLRDRFSDVLFLANHFLRRFCTETGNDSVRFSPSAIKALEAHTWPGNVRELENRVRRAVIMAEGNTVKPSDLELGGHNAPASGRSLKEAREELERRMVEESLRRHDGKIAPAAVELGISRPTFYELIERLGIKRAGA
ncbi:MAG: PEP-CTERM-box response regulator transcription factor [Verrucomicrobia bacterium]|nr:PEP-CTERM-box response regulator transcription factor [Verrucomicrobiota bacterium]MBI3867946.1 PEP-CTERM-box response regulator transcription factor [Verrucomicrobiota bacterium]